MKAQSRCDIAFRGILVFSYKTGIFFPVQNDTQNLDLSCKMYLDFDTVLKRKSPVL